MLTKSFKPTSNTSDRNEEEGNKNYQSPPSGNKASSQKKRRAANSDEKESPKLAQQKGLGRGKSCQEDKS